MKRGKDKRRLARRLRQAEENWRLPSGQSLEEFALHAGFVGSLLTVSEVLEREQSKVEEARDEAAVQRTRPRP